MSVTIEQLELEIQSNSTSAVNSIEALSTSLSKIKAATKGGIGLNSVGNSIVKFNTALSSIDSSSLSKINELMSGLKELKSIGDIKISSSIGNQLVNIGYAVEVISDIDLSGISKLSQALEALNNIDKASGLQSTVSQLKKLPQLEQTLNDINWENFTSQIQQLSNSLTPLVNQLNSVSEAFSRLPSNIKDVATATDKVTKANKKASTSWVNIWAKLKIAAKAVKEVANALAKCVNLANQYIEDMNLFSVSLGEYAQEAKEYAEQVGEIMGIDPGEWMRNQGTFNTIISGFGVASDKAALMSKNLTQLGYDISSFFNISVEDAMQKLESGISGELEPLRRLGYDLSIARLQQEALNLGIEKSVSDMTQAEKSQLRYYAIMTQVTEVQDDMARTLTSPANQLRIFKTQITLCARTLGNIFIPVVNAVLPYLIAFAKALRLVLEEVAQFLNITLPDVDWSNISSGADIAGDLADSVGDTTEGLNDATSAAKKLKNVMIGMDELNIISSNSDTDTNIGSGVGSGGDLGITLPEYDFIGEAVDTKVNEITQKIKDAFGEILTAIADLELILGLILIATGVNLPLGVALLAIGAVTLVTAAVIDWHSTEDKLSWALSLLTNIVGTALLAIGAVLAFSGGNIPLGIGLMIAGATTLATKVVLNWTGVSEDVKTVITLISSIVGTALLAIGAILVFSGANIPLGLGMMAAGGVTLANTIVPNWNSISDTLNSVCKKVNDWGTNIIDSFSTTCDNISSTIDNFEKKFKNKWNEITEKTDDIKVEVKLWFSQKEEEISEKWEELTTGIKDKVVTVKTTIQDKIGETKQSISDWWTEKKKSLTDKISYLKIAVNNKVGQKKIDIKEWWDTKKKSLTNKTSYLVTAVKNKVGSKAQDIKEWWDAKKKSLTDKTASLKVNLSDKLTSAFKKMIRDVIDYLNGWVDKINGVLPGNPVKKLSYPSWAAYKDGGFPTQGQMFLARESGPELVGTIGRKTAVVNNEQIVESVSAGVEYANSKQNALLIEQNNLLRQLLEKDFGVEITANSLAKTLNRKNTRDGKVTVPVTV